MKRIFLLVLSIFLISGVGKVNANTCPFTIEMDIGTKHDQVTLLQDFMKNILLIYEGPTTGYFGPMSATAVKVFQKNSGLLLTGKLDNVTKAVLCQIHNSYNVNKNIATPSQTISGECFIKTLGLSRGYFDKATDEVMELQKYLNQKGFYPENITSGYFGILTEVALKKFQTASGITNSGVVDGATFKTICGYESSQTIGCPFVTNNLAAGFFEEANNEVKTLQMILVKLNLLDSQYQTGFFGKITTDAVKKFQEKTNLSQTGILNIETRTVLCDMIEMPLSVASKSDNPKEMQSSNVDVAISGVNMPVEKIDVNTKVPIIVKAKNIGTEMSGKFKSALYLDDKIEASVETFELKPDQEAIVMAHTWTCKAKGIYALKIFLDNDNQLIEKNKFNNVLVVPINCGNVAQDDFKYVCDTTKYQCVISDKGTMLKEECEKMCKADAQKDLPDLTVTEFKPTKSTVKVGEKVSITVVEKNIGKSAAGVHQVSFKINDKDQTGNWPALDPGKENRNDTIEWSCQVPGVYLFTFTTNSDNKLKEESLTNNSRSFEIRCTDEKGNVPEKGKEDVVPPPSGDKKPPTPPSENRGRDGSGETGGSGGGGLGDEDTVDIPKAGRCGAIDNLNVGAAICTTISGRSNKANPLPKGVDYFSLYPLDTINCVDKKNETMGRCDCCNFYRASPHRAELSLGGFDCENGKLDCAIDFGDGSPIEKWTKDDRVYIDDGNPVSNSWLTQKVHYYKISDDKEYEVFCPKLIVNGQRYSLTNPFINDYEDREKCIIVFKPNFASSPYHPGTVPWADYVPKRTSADERIGQKHAPCDLTPQFFSLKASASNNVATLDIWLNVNGGDSYLKKCPAVCVITWGDGSKEQVLPCWMKNSITHTYKRPGTYKINVTLNSFYDYSPHDDCIQRGASVVIKQVGQEIPEGAAKLPNEKSNEIGLSCNIKETSRPIENAVSVKIEAEVKDKKGCNDFVFAWGDMGGWGAGKTKLSDYLEMSFLAKEGGSNINVSQKVKALCKTDPKIYGTVECNETFAVEKKKDDPIVVLGAEETLTKSSTTGGWFTNLINNIFGDRQTDLRAPVDSMVNVQSEKRYTCKAGTCVETNTGGTSLSECMKGCFAATFSNLFEGRSVENFVATTTRPVTSIKIENNFSFDTGIGAFKPTTTTKPTTSFQLDSSVFNFQNINLFAPTTTKSASNFSTLSGGFSFDGLNFGQVTQITKYKYDAGTGKCIIANNLDKNTYSSMKECEEKNVSLNTTTINNSFGNFNFQFNQ